MDFASLHELPCSTYDDDATSAQMTGIAKGIAGLSALYSHGLHSPCRGDRRFPLSDYSGLFVYVPPTVTGTMNAVLSPVVQGTEMMASEGNFAELTAKRDVARGVSTQNRDSLSCLQREVRRDRNGYHRPEDAVTIRVWR